MQGQCCLSRKPSSEYLHVQAVHQNRYLLSELLLFPRAIPMAAKAAMANGVEAVWKSGLEESYATAVPGGAA